MFLVSLELYLMGDCKHTRIGVFMCMFMPLLVNQKKELTLLGWGSAFGLTIWVPGGIMPFGGSLTSTSKPASKRQDHLQDNILMLCHLVRELELVISAYPLFTVWEIFQRKNRLFWSWHTLTYLFQCHQWWRGLYRGLLLLESSWRCRFHQCWHESAYSHWVCVGNGQ